MYCLTCGKEIENTVNFCSSCGAGADHSQPERYQSSAPVMTLKPRFIPWLSVLSALPVQIFLTIWGAFFFGGFATAGMSFVTESVPKWVPFVVAGLLFFLGIPILAFINKQKTYANTEFRFYPGKLDYYEGFFTTEEKSIDYDNITEVNLRKGVLQKMYGLGTIVLSTPATGWASGRAARSGILIPDIANPDGVYRELKALLKRF